VTGACQPGNSNAACGLTGTTCVACGVGQNCDAATGTCI
jgi:hypothetical protein